MRNRSMPAVCAALLWCAVAAAEGPKETPPMPAWAQQRGYALWVEDSMVKIGPATRPKAYDEKPAVALALAGREYETFQVAIVPVREGGLKNVRAAFGPLRSGRNTLPAENLRWHLVGYVLAGKERVPDMLLPVTGFAADKDTTYAILVTVHAPADQPPGTYTGQVALEADGAAPASIPLTVEVYPFTLPEGPAHCRTAFALQRGRAFDPGEFRAYADFMLDHRLNPDDIYAPDFPAVADLEHYYTRGMNNFTLRAGWTNDAIRKFLDELAKAPHGAEIRKTAILYGWDEKPKAQWPAMQARFRAFKEAFPDIPTNTTAHLYMTWDGMDPVAAMKEYAVDQICPWIHPGYPKYYDYAVGEKLRRAGLQQWAYNINFQTHFPLIQPRLTFWEMYVLKADGWLYYCVNGWDKAAPKIDPDAGAMVAYTPHTPTSQGELLYRGLRGPIGSLRLSNIRDGIEDYEYLYLLAQKAGDVEVAREQCERVCWDALKWVEDPARLRETRRELARWLTQPHLARSPSPAHRAADAAPDATLSWRSDQPEAVRSFDVYLGTDAAAVAAAAPKAPEYRGRQKETLLRPGALRPGATYYWRVDEITRQGTFKGYPWRFTVAPVAVGP